MVKNKTKVGRCLLTKILHNKNMTPSELADKVNMQPSQISDYMNNRKSMSLKNARRISKALRCHIDCLYEWDE